MKRYKLKKDLPTLKAGQEFFIGKDGSLYREEYYDEDGEWLGVVCAYAESTLEKFPNILTDWFEEIPEKQKTVWDLEYGDGYYSLSALGTASKLTWYDEKIQRLARSAGNVFLTHEEAEKELARSKAKVTLERDTKGFKPDWHNQPS